jgi:hypothetical protein
MHGPSNGNFWVKFTSSREHHVIVKQLMENYNKILNKYMRSLDNYKRKKLWITFHLLVLEDPNLKILEKKVKFY